MKPGDVQQPGQVGEFDPLKTPFVDQAAAFPCDGAPEEQYLFLLRYAIVAPSTHNSQPWRFRVNPDGLEVFADYRRRMPNIDPGSRELLMSVGAAIFNLSVAARHFGLPCLVEYNLSEASEKAVAKVRLAPVGLVKHAQLHDPLFPHILARRTNRDPFLLSRVPTSVLHRIGDVAAHTEVEVIVSEDGGVNERVAQLVAEAEMIQWADAQYRKDTAEWIRPDEFPGSDGITGTVFGWSGPVPVIGSYATRTIDQGRLRAARDRNLCVEAPGLILVACEDSAFHWLKAGEVLEHMLLMIAKEGLQTSYFNMPVQVPELRARLKTLLDCSTWPQLLLRVGFSLTPLQPTPRRPLEEMLIKE